MSGKKIGYIRVSTGDQNPDRQLEGMELDKRFIDFASAKSKDRPQLKSLLEFVREDDVVFVHSMDRLARNVKDLKELVDFFVEKKIEVRFVKENICFSGESSAMSNFLLHVMGAFAEFEHAFIRERQREGIEVARKLGRLRHRKEKLSKEMIEKLKEEMKTRKSKSKIAEDFGISRQCVYRYLKKYEIA